jgi:hypothetical protein
MSYDAILIEFRDRRTDRTVWAVVADRIVWCTPTEVTYIKCDSGVRHGSRILPSEYVALRPCVADRPIGR